MVTVASEPGVIVPRSHDEVQPGPDRCAGALGRRHEALVRPTGQVTRVEERRASDGPAFPT